ncbi:MAG: glycosyltransferase, partial [Proteobacteria bacterium]|nr:glycosyltransferase [Pseudomonadota bacterium]
VLVGVNVPEPEYGEVAALAGGGVVVERARADFTTLLANCGLSISQGGYNTLMEVLEAGTRAVIVPYAGGIETEQTLRAREMAKLGAFQVVNEDDLSPRAIARAADAALAGPPTSNAGLDTAGAEKTADLVRGWADALDW